jgi:hypothetical protein
MSPQASNHEAYHPLANDIWGIGLIFYQMICKGHLYNEKGEWSKLVEKIRSS